MRAQADINVTPLIDVFLTLLIIFMVITPIQPTVAVAVDLETLFAKFSEEYQADKELLKRIARCESGFNPEAVNGIYAGMFQFAPQSWVSVRNGMGLDTKTDLRTNVEESIRTAAYMIGHGQASAWPSCR